MMAWSSVGSPSELAPADPGHARSSVPLPLVLGPEDSLQEEVEEAEDVLAASSRVREDEEEEEEDEEDVERYRASSVDDVCVSKADSSCPSSAGSFGLDPLSIGMRRSLSPRHHPLLSPMHMAKAAGFAASPGRQVSPARSDAGGSSRAGCKRSVSSAINGKELLSLPPSHSLPVSPLSHRKFFAHRSPQRSLSHSRMSPALPPHLTGSVGAVVTILGPEEDAGASEDSDEHRQRMRDILQNLPLAEIYKKRARRNNSRERQDASRHASSSDAPPPSEATTSMEVLISTPSQETPPLSASSSGRHNFKKAMRDRYLLSQGHRGGGGSSGGGSTSSQDSAASGGRLPLDLTSDRFTKIREPLKSETEDLLASPHLLLTDEMDVLGAVHPPPPAILLAQGNSAAARSLLQQHQQRLLLSTASGSLGDDDPFYPSVPAGGATVAPAVSCSGPGGGTAFDPVQLIARTCRIESSSSSYLSVDMDSDPFSPMSPISPCLASPKHLTVAPPGSGGGATVTGQHPPPQHPHGVTATASAQHLAPSAAVTAHWMHPPPSLAPTGAHRSGPYPVSPALQHPGAVPVPRQCQSAPQTPHSSPQIRPQFFFPPHAQMPPPAVTTSSAAGILSPSPVPPLSSCSGASGGLSAAAAVPEALCKIPSFESLPVTSAQQRRSTSSAVSSPGLSPRGFESPQSDGKSTCAGGEMSPGPGARVTHGCPVCGRSFSRSDMLSRHMRLHTGMKPYECASCGQSFSRSDHLNTHIRTHTGEKPYHCPQCAYSACRRDMITRHMKVHRRKLAGPASGATGSPPPPSQPPGVCGTLLEASSHSSADSHAPGPPEERPP